MADNTGQEMISTEDRKACQTIW